MNEKIRIGKDVYIEILNVLGPQKKVRIGITAPADVEIMRTELYDPAAAEAKAAAKAKRLQDGSKRPRVKRPFPASGKRVPRVAVGARARPGKS
jgi:carbon storage regulator CsrA